MSQEYEMLQRCGFFRNTVKPKTWHAGVSSLYFVKVRNRTNAKGKNTVKSMVRLHQMIWCPLDKPWLNQESGVEILCDLDGAHYELDCSVRSITGLTEFIRFLTVAIQLCVWYLQPMQTKALQPQEQISEGLDSTWTKDFKFSLDGNLWMQLGFLGALSAFLMYLFSCACPIWYGSKLS